jgi:CheY-like chemotaxis protein
MRRREDPKRRQRPLIAVVNDDQVFIDLLRDLLTEEGYDVLTHPSGETAYALIRKKQPNLVILDMRLEHPEGGWMVLDLLRLDPETADLPVIVCSADAHFLRAKAAQLREEGCCVLEKPFRLDKLLALMEEALHPEFRRCAPSTM